MNKVWTVVGGTVLTAAVLAPWGVGVLTEQQWQGVTQRINDAQAFIQFEPVRYERRFYGATIHGVVRMVDPVSGSAESLPYEGSVSHGLTGSRIDFALAEEFATVAASELARVFPDAQPSLTLAAKVWGTATLEARVPAIDYTDAAAAEAFQLAPSFARLVVSNGGETAELSVRGPALTLSVGVPTALHLALEDVRVDQTMSLERGRLWTGEGEMGVARAEFRESGSEPLVVENFQLSSQTWTDTADSFNTATVASVSRLTAKGASNGPHRVEFAANEINIDAWNELVTAVTDLQALSAGGGETNPQLAFQQQMMLLAQVGESAKKLAVNGVSAGFPAISLASPEGAVQGRLLLSHPKLGAAEQNQMHLLTRKLEGVMNLSLPVALAERYPHVQEQLLPLLDQGVVIEDNGAYRVDARLENLTLDVNGRKFPLPPLI
ncbi:DUF945 family protein [Marinobacter sp. X15-166B]|uniref:DUF945 family protein n=1 Tax=Marinobacter sp. X15-166B TaxID=1897620 RepID=UPI00085BF323|nr:DUF945 family protein [Marinobacter sp. X15-166B]OEY65754.1 hypothetical protein BG841_04315 [Marinobacter sp. X15-166B]